MVVEPNIANLTRFAHALLAGSVTSPPVRRFPLEQVAAAHALLEAGNVGSKVVLISRQRRRSRRRAEARATFDMTAACPVPWCAADTFSHTRSRTDRLGQQSVTAEVLRLVSYLRMTSASSSNERRRAA
ncbi:MAG: zinc-binding dehydrogenase [Labilithrix sp.]|nr:zinc-binding dehydrogenase [Labilithrix sp.]